MLSHMHNVTCMRIGSEVNRHNSANEASKGGWTIERYEVRVEDEAKDSEAGLTASFLRCVAKSSYPYPRRYRIF